jgi:hypothetical protein
MKVIIIESKKITYDNFIYDNKSLEEVSSYKYLIIDIHHKLIWNYSVQEMINGGWKAYYGLENKSKLANFCLWDKENSSLRFSSLLLSYMDMNFGDAVSPENSGER